MGIETVVRAPEEGPMLDSSSSNGRGFPFGRLVRIRCQKAGEDGEPDMGLRKGKGASGKARKQRSQFNGNLFSRLLNRHANGNSNRRKGKRRSNPNRGSGAFRKSSSTHITSRSSAFLSDHFNECITMEDFLIAEELASFATRQEESKQEVDVPDDSSSGIVMPPLHRSPAPESYYRLTKNQHEELGNIHFEFDSLEEARRASARREQPILCIEAEFPGDVTTGTTIFSHPLIVEAAESLFVTVQPRQLEPQDENDGVDDSFGYSFDRRFFTKSSCRTRVRILDDRGMDVLSPVENMSLSQVLHSMVSGLESYRTHVPKYLQLFLEEESGKHQVLSKTRSRDIQRRAVFGMFNSVKAEVAFAELDGVLSTRSGVFGNRQQAVEVIYDSSRLSFCALVRHSLRAAGVNLVYFESNDERIAAQLEVQRYEGSIGKIQQRYADEKDEAKPSIKIMKGYGNMRASQNSKPALRGSILKFVPMTDLQATQANRLIHLQQFHKAMHLLSPRQGLIAMQAMQAHGSNAFQDVVDIPICTAWNELSPDVRPAAPQVMFNHHYVPRHYGSSDDDDDDLTISDCSTDDPTEEYEDQLLQ